MGHYNTGLLDGMNFGRATGRCIVHAPSCKIIKTLQLTKYNLDG